MYLGTKLNENLKTLILIKEYNRSIAFYPASLMFIHMKFYKNGIRKYLSKYTKDMEIRILYADGLVILAISKDELQKNWYIN